MVNLAFVKWLMGSIMNFRFLGFFFSVFLLSFSAFGQVAAQNCDENFVALDPNVLQVNVLPTGSDDTENIQCALEAAASEGIPTVKLDRAIYFISSISVEGFSGSLEGTTRSDSVIRILGGSVSCSSISAGGQIPAALKFVEGRPTVQFLRFEFDSNVQPCTSGEPLRALVHFSGRPTGTSECSNDVIFGQVDRVDFVGRGPGIGSQRAVTAIPEATVLGGCKDTLLGTIKVNRSSFSNFGFAVSTELRGSAQVDINFNSFSHDAPGNVADITLLNTGQSTSVIGNEFSGISDPDEGYTGIFFGATRASAPNTTRLAVENNSFSAGDFGSVAVPIAIGLDSVQQPPNALVSIVNNNFSLFSSDDTDAVGIFVTGGVSGNSINRNRFAGSGIGIFMSSDITTIADWFMGGNSGFANLSSSLRDIVLFTNTFNNIVGPNQSASVFDDGNNFVFTGNTTNSFQEVSSSGVDERGGTVETGIDNLTIKEFMAMQEAVRKSFMGQ